MRWKPLFWARNTVNYAKQQVPQLSQKLDSAASRIEFIKEQLKSSSSYISDRLDIPTTTMLTDHLNKTTEQFSENLRSVQSALNYMKDQTDQNMKFIENVVWAIDRMNSMKEQINDKVTLAMDTEYWESLVQARHFNEKDLLMLLAACAEDSYTFSGEPLGNRLSLVHYQYENIYQPNLIQFGIYKVTQGSHFGETIVAFRGTATMAGLLQDLDYTFGSGIGIIKAAIENAEQIASQYKADWVCGHSLGGLLAECVSSRTRIGGAAFNSPGPLRINNLVEGTSYSGVPFEVHLTFGDPVSLFGGPQGPDLSHISRPIWHYYGLKYGPGFHSIFNLRRDIGVLR